MSMASNSHPGAVAGAAKSPTDKSYRPAAEDTAIVENERKNYKSIFMENPFVPVGKSYVTETCHTVIYFFLLCD